MKSLKERIRQLGVLFFAGLLLLLSHAGAAAQSGYPQAQDLYVNDYADLLTSQDAANIKAMFRILREEEGIEATVLTIDSIDDYGTGDRTIESFATNLFNLWGIGDAVKNDGVLLLVAFEDREVRIEVGSGYGNSQNRAMQDVIDDQLLPAFRQGDFSEGIYQGSRAIVAKLTGEWPVNLSADSSGSVASGLTDSSSENVFIAGYNWLRKALADAATLVIGAAAVVLGGVGLGVRQYFRLRKRDCPECGFQLERLNESADDDHLQAGQIQEEQLHSVDYDVWQCPNCSYSTILAYRNWFTGKKRCPSCSYRTVNVSHETMVAATYSSSGQRRVTLDCHHCSYHDERYEMIPKKTRSKSSGSSFGGGRSSGGGASGKW